MSAPTVQGLAALAAATECRLNSLYALLQDRLVSRRACFDEAVWDTQLLDGSVGVLSNQIMGEDVARVSWTVFNPHQSQRVWLGLNRPAVTDQGILLMPGAAVTLTRELHGRAVTRPVFAVGGPAPSLVQLVIMRSLVYRGRKQS